ncbi:histidine kinase [Paenibacillus selenitireducens]|uniref:Histidine kinase n=1 Tax=Paenibacillus selenitireducens TaxID=1324314 RepID=A0A1T2X2E3_9BACL|nr:AAA family ATPase [Paenibacillus selenitireducens]OPA74061.1 histidine kinase [Paenibacillus selenitireducens]
MIEIPGYQTLDVIGSHGDIQLYRLLRLKDRRNVILKTTCDEFPGPAMIEAFRYEYDKLTRLGGRGALEVYHLEIIAERPMMFLQDIGGSRLDRVLCTRSNALGLPVLLRIAIAAVDSLMQIHREKMTLHDITPFHLIVNPDTFEVKFIDIRRCSTEQEKSPLPLLSGRSDDILPYISPELTGRTGITPDYRSDFYSLGITLYEWLSGSLPFAFQDVLDIVYRHLASTPQPLHHRVLSIPRPVSDIIGKCMEKMPDARYASAFGLKSDLQECLEQYQASGKVDSFVLASRDIPERWTVPAHFYGRRKEQRCLQEALQRASEGAAEVVWIKGSGGIGKTSLVRETFRKLVPFEGIFAKGKCNPQHTALPYDVWVQAIGELVGQLLMENKLQEEVWKLRILNAVDGYGQLLIDFVPKLELLIGKQQQVQPLPPVQAQHRLHTIMNRFLQLFLHPNHPLVVFLDDLQWADDASLQYLAHLLEDRATKNLLIVMACRAETSVSHPVHRLSEELAERNIAMSSIHLKALELEDLQQLIRDAMRYQGSDTDELAQLLLHKTEGNPFFLKQFLQDLIDDKQVTFDEWSGSWQWDLQRIGEMSVPDNAADYLSDKLKLFSYPTVYVLGRAAFLGSSFDLNTLSSITELSLHELAEVMTIAMHERLLQPVGVEGAQQYRFQHDRIHQAAYALVDEIERPDLHGRIGWLFIHRMKSGEGTNIFEAVNHLNQALARIPCPEQKLEVAALNLQAGLKAKQSTAYETSLAYLRQATSLLDEESWNQDYALTFSAFQERAETEFLCAQFETANDLFDILIHKAATNLDKARVCTIKIQLEANHDNYEKVISLGRTTLALLDVRHNFTPSSTQLTLQWLRLRRKIRKHPLESLGQLPPMNEETRRVAMTALVHTGHACYFIHPKGWLASTFTMLEMTLDYGLTPEASIGFVGYAMFLYFHFRQDEEAFTWGMLACNVSRPYPTLYVKTLTSFTLCYDSWRRYDPTLLKMFTDHAGKVGLESGDLWHGNQSVLVNCASLLQFGHPLGDIYDRLIAQSGDFQRHNNSLHWKQAAIFTSLLVRLTGYRAPDDPFELSDVMREDFADSVHGDEFQMIQELVYTLQYLPGYLFGQYQEANEALKKSAAIIALRQDDSNRVVQYMYESLVWAQLYEEMSVEEQKECWMKLRYRLKKMKKYAMRCPENYQHKYLLIHAEMARLTSKNRQAEDFYSQSMETARSNGHIHDLAIAAECYGRYSLRQGKLQLAKVYMTEAYEAYVQWGAAAKAADLEQKYGHLLHISGQSGLERVDSLSVVMAAQALSGEMEMSRLLDTLMRIMLHNAGAEYGALLFDHEDKWVIEVHGTEEELRIESIPLEEESNLVPAAIIGYAARTQEEVVLHDAAQEGLFVQIPYVMDKDLKSILCLPVIHQNKLICLLYMENKLSRNIFTPHRLDVLKMLGSQCAISIMNAKLYAGIQYLTHHLEDQVEERTRSLERSMRETSAALAEVSIYEERNRIAHEIHDIVGHTLTSTILQIEAGKRLLSKDITAGVQRLNEAQDLVRHSLNEIRGSVHMLKEDKYADLSAMLNRLIQDTERNAGVVIHRMIHDVPELSIFHKKMIYHALQEGLTNGIRHGRSKEFRFSLELVGSYVQFRLEDKGLGTDQITLGFGLKAMKERAEQLGGRFMIDSWANRGSLLGIDLPIRSGGLEMRK